MSKKNLLGIALLCLFTTVMSQTQEKETFKVHVDKETGKTYWNRHLPVFLNLSTEPNGEGLAAGISQDKERVEKPYQFDTEGTNYIRTRWKTDPEGNVLLPKTDLLWPVECDGVKPNSTIIFHYANKYRSNGVVYFDGTLSYSIKATDQTSGVERTMNSVNGGNYTKYSKGEKIKLSKGKNTVKAYSVDRVGNMENAEKPTTNKSFIVDEQAPITEYTVTGPRLENILSPKCVINLTATDNASGVKNIKYKSVKRKTTIHTNSGIAVSTLQRGENHISYFATDNVNNKENEKQFDFFIDHLGPNVDFSVDKDEYISNNKVRFVSPRSSVVLKSDDNKAGVAKIQFGFSETERDEYVQPIPVQNLTKKYNKFYYTAIDKVENKGKVKFFSFNIDRKAPKVNWSTKGKHLIRRDTIYLTSHTEIKLTAYDQDKINSGVKEIRYKIGKSAVEIYNDKFTFSTSNHNSLLVKGIDNVNNDQERLYNFFVDDIAPEIFHHFSVKGIANKTIKSETNTVYPTKTYLYLAAKDGTVGNDKIFYKINSGQEKPYIQPISGFKANTDFSIEVIAIDLLGNKSRKTIKFSTADEI